MITFSISGYAQCSRALQEKYFVCLVDLPEYKSFKLHWLHNCTSVEVHYQFSRGTCAAMLEIRTQVRKLLICYPQGDRQKRWRHYTYSLCQNWTELVFSYSFWKTHWFEPFKYLFFFISLLILSKRAQTNTMRDISPIGVLVLDFHFSR